MDYYYSSGSAMSSRGRFSSQRGSSYRGAGRGGGESSYRGSRGGGGGYTTSRGSYNSSRGREQSRYATHTRIEEPIYRKPESSSYGSSHEHSHRRSEPDMTRKRIRSDSYSQSSQGLGSRRSHEVEDYRGGGSRYANANSYTDSRTYSENRAVFKKPRPTEYKPKDEYRGRKEITRPSAPASKLRSFRGRTVRGRGILRRNAEGFLTRKRSVFSGSRGSSASEMLALRRQRLIRIRRLRETAKLQAALSSAEKKSKEGKSGDEEETEEKAEGTEEKSGEEKEKKEDGEVEENAESKDKEKSKEDDHVDFFGKPFMKLQCPQCSTKCITFKEYIHHLYQPVHIVAMKEKSSQLKSALAKMRIAQRAKQKKTDEDDLTSMNTRTIFCPICKLNYSQEKSIHQSSEAHKKMKNFLQPYCKICRIAYKSPMLYENHICSLEHIRRKNSLDERLGKSKGSSLEYLDNFMVVDSVGSGDEGEENKDENKDEESKKETEKESEKEKEKSSEKKEKEENVNMGVEFIRRVEVFYCEVCRTYLPRHLDKERALRVHCRSQNHWKNYFRFGTDELLEQIKGKTKKKDSDKKEKDTEKSEESKDKHNESSKMDDSVDDEVGIDDKLWADVNDLLNEVGPQVKSDDEDEEESGRFDRFKSNEKKENGEVPSSEETVKDEEKDVKDETMETDKSKEGD